MIQHRLITQLAVLAVSFSGCLTAQTWHVVSVTDHRPLWGALDQLETAFSGPINYEEASYENDNDLEAVTDPKVRKEVNGRSVRVPRKGSVTVEFEEVSSANGKLLCLNDLLASYRRNNLPGDYRVEEANGMLYVVGFQTRGKDGNLRAVKSPMVAPITLPFAKRRVFQTVALIADQISKVNGVRVLVGSMPNGLAEVSFGAQGDSGRLALARLFREVSPDLQVSYRLLFDPLEDGYMLNIRAVGLREGATGSSSPSAEPASSKTGKWLDPVRP